MGIKEKAAAAADRVREEIKVLTGDKSKDKQYESNRQFSDEASAKTEFDESKKRLFDVNHWSNIPGAANAKFQLYTEQGEPLDRSNVQRGDFIMIDLPGPLPSYWVRVNEISDEENAAQFTVQPVHNPTERDDKVATDHFFQDRARSVFRVERKGTSLVAMEIGKNEAINNKKHEAGDKAVTNTLVSQGGWAMFQKYQWKNLTDYLIGEKD